MIRRRLFASSTKREIRHFHVTAKKCTKKRDARAKLLFCLTNPFLFLALSLLSPPSSSLLKFPNNAFGEAVKKLGSHGTG